MNQLLDSNLLKRLDHSLAPRTLCYRKDM